MLNIFQNKRKRNSSHTKEKGAITRNFRYILLFVIALFTLAALLLGEWLNLYQAIWWWDDMLHGTSGTILGLIGLLALYFFNTRRTVALQPIFAAIFVFCFAMTMGVLWEMFEFTVDYFTKIAMQQWDMPPQAIVIGKDYQGMGLRDTMSDLILASIGALVASTATYLACKHQRPVVHDVMRHTFPWIKWNSKK